MPEAAEVRIIADVLGELCIGKFLIAIDHDSQSRYAKSPMRRLEQFRSLLPRKILDVRTKGKKIIFDLGGIYMISFLGMEGQWRVQPANHSNLTLSIGEIKYFKHSQTQEQTKLCVIERILYYDDSRHFGALDLLFSDEELDKYLSRLGPDILQTIVTSEEWKKIFSLKRIQNKQITAVLLDQSVVSSLGNWLRCQILYDSKINPGKLVSDLTMTELESLRVHSHRIVREAYAKKGASLRTYVDPYGRKGDYEPVIYGKKKDPHGNPVVGETFKDGRTTWWCPAVQK